MGPSWQFQTGFQTPLLIRRLIQIISAVTLLSVLLDSSFSTGLQELLAMSPLTYQKLFLWQPFTALFLIPSALFSFGFLLDFAFAMLLLWLLGSLLLERIGPKKFLFAYIASGLLSGLAALCSMHYFSVFTLASACLPALLAVAMLWTMADPNQQLILFFVLPLRAKWILVIALAGTLLSSLVQHDFTSFFSYATAVVFSYFYGVLALNFYSPFTWMTGFEKLLKRLQYSLRTVWQWKILGVFRKQMDLRKAREDASIDKILEKISKEGESSLSFYEKMKLKWVSLKKR